MKIYDCNKIAVEVDKELGYGGEATVYTMKGKPDVLCKIFHPNKITPTIQNKVKAMINSKVFKTLQKNQNYSLPLIEVFDEKNKWIGYAKRKAEGVNLALLANLVFIKKFFPKIQKVDVIATLIKFLKDIKRLHDNDILIGDYNLSNFLANSKTYDISFIDTDSWQFSYRQKNFRCTVGTADMTPPEQQYKDFNSFNRTIQSELFSIAVLLFKVLMLGRHPYDCIGGDTVVKNIEKGYFYYDLKTKPNSKIPKGPWFDLWQELDEEIKMLFIKTFGYKGEKNQRATIEEWIEALSNYKFKLEGGKRKRLNLMNSKKTNKKTSTDDKTETIAVVENINQEEPVKRKRGRPPKTTTVSSTVATIK